MSYKMKHMCYLNRVGKLRKALAPKVSTFYRNMESFAVAPSDDVDLIMALALKADKLKQTYIKQKHKNKHNN